MPSITLPIAIGATAVAGLGSAVIGGIASSSAANTQANAEQYAANEMMQQYQQTRSDLLPYNLTGQAANQAITNMGPFQFAPTEAQLETTPGYQFNLFQGEKAVQNSAAARGLGVSGAAFKGASQFASGLADTTYQNQFSNALAQYNENLAKLQGQAGLGESAAAQTGAYGTQTAANIGQTAVGAANARAAGTIGMANAFSGGLGSIGQALFMGQLFKNGGGGVYGPSYDTGLSPTGPPY